MQAPHTQEKAGSCSLPHQQLHTSGSLWPRSRTDQARPQPPPFLPHFPVPASFKSPHRTGPLLCSSLLLPVWLSEQASITAWSGSHVCGSALLRTRKDSCSQLHLARKTSATNIQHLGCLRKSGSHPPNCTQHAPCPAPVTVSRDWASRRAPVCSQPPQSRTTTPFRKSISCKEDKPKS